MSSVRFRPGAPIFEPPVLPASGEPPALPTGDAGKPPILRVNIVLFAPSELGQALPRQDERARHVLKVLRRQVGDSFDVGQINGPRGKATLTRIDENELSLDWSWSAPHPPPPPTCIGVGFPRPQTGRDILRDATTLGATELSFLRTDRSDPNYASSSLWTSGEWQRHALTGAAQAFDTHLPQVTWQESLHETLQRWRTGGSRLIALDVYANKQSLARFSVKSADESVALLLGPERGWSDVDRACLHRCGAEFFNLGSRVLRTETAVTAALTLLNAARVRS